MNKQRKYRYMAMFLCVCWLLLQPLTATAAAKRLPPAAPETTAQSAVLMDGNGTVLFAKNPHDPLPPASVTKVMTLLLAVEAVEQGRIRLEDRVRTSENSWRQGGSQIWLEPGEELSVQELLTAIAVVSANDAAAALMEHIYGSTTAAIEAMNQRAAELELQHTHFNSVNGLPVDNHYMSAYDTALLAKEALHHPLYLQLCSIKEYWLRDGKNWLVNTNKLLWWYKGADGLKTGWTEEAKYCFAGTAERDGLRLISVVFAVAEPRGHLRESMKLMDWGFANFAAATVTRAGECVGQVRVTRGTVDQVDVVAEEELTVAVPKGELNSIEKTVLIDDTRTAPLAVGEVCGQLVAMRSGQELGRVDIVTATSIEAAGLYQCWQRVAALYFSGF